MRDVSDISDVLSEVRERAWTFLTAEITDRAVAIAKDLELDMDPDRLTSRRLGRALGSMRLEKSREPGTGKRGWRISWGDLERWTTAYAISLLEATGLSTSSSTGMHSQRDADAGLGDNVTDVTDVTDVTESDLVLYDPPPSRPCWTSEKHRRFWRRPTGGWVCARCHPPPPGLQVDQWDVA